MDKINVGELFGKSVEDLQMQAEVQTLKNRNYQLEHDVSDQREYIKHLENQIKQLSETKKKVRYKVVRSYNLVSSGGTKSLVDAFADGWEFVRASEYIPRDSCVGFFEYILRKEVENENNY